MTDIRPKNRIGQVDIYKDGESRDQPSDSSGDESVYQVWLGCIIVVG